MSINTDPDPELHAEQRALARIQRAQANHLARAASQAERLAAEVAELTEEGIRDLVDEDAEADAAVQAAFVRQAADRAMHAARRVTELQEAGWALAFGHTTGEASERRYVGRLTVLDDDDVLLVDWRAPAAVPFYQATPLGRMGVDRRRTFLYGDGQNADQDQLVSYSDELFDPDAAAEEMTTGANLRGEAALLASVTAPTNDHMRSVVATIQAEQDAIIRAPADKPLVVQGGPGTGKTVVALHRAAYLLYAQREALSDTGVLVIGPTSEFLAYIADVLPSLGETGVISVTAPELYPGVRRGREEDPAVAAIKGRLDMATLLANAIDDRRRRPSIDLNTWYGARRVTLGCVELQRLFDRAAQYSTHNEGSDVFRFDVIEALTDEVFDPLFHNRDDARSHFRGSDVVGEFLLRQWPSLSPEEALNDLFGSPALLRSAARHTQLSPSDLRALHRPRTPYAQVGEIRWSHADIPLLDELLDLVGISLDAELDDERIVERDAADEFELATAADDSDDEPDDDLEDEGLGEVTSFEELSRGGDPLFDTSVLDHRYEVFE